jgi:hypothetical protein
MQIEAEEKPTPDQAWETTKYRLSEKRPDKVGWLRLGILKKFHEGLFIVEFPASAMDDARKLSHEMLVQLNQTINRELTRQIEEEAEILTQFLAE